MKKSLNIAMLLILSFLCVASLGACEYVETPQHRGEIFALDTLITVTAYGDKGMEGISAAKAEIRRLEKLLSVTDKDSDVSRLNSSKGETLEVSKETYEVLEYAKSISAETQGKFDVSIYPIMKLWGFSDKSYTVPGSTEIKATLPLINYNSIELLSQNKVRIPEGTKLDLGGIAKGYIADKAADKMEEIGVEAGTVSLGGNVKLFGSNPKTETYSIGINHPDDKVAFCKVDAKEGSLVTSGAYQRNFTKDGVTYHHIIDPETGYPAESDILSVTVICQSGATADGLSTALFIGGVEYTKSLQKNGSFNFDYIILDKNYNLIASKAMEGKLTLHPGYESIDISYS